MDIIFMNSDNSKTPDLQWLLLNLSDNINLIKIDEYVVLSDLSIFYTWKNIKKSSRNNKLKTSGITWNEKFELPDESYFLSDI